MDLDRFEGGRTGSPANPDALGFGSPNGPELGRTYAPAIDHTTFLPGAQIDWLLLSTEQSNLPVPPLGTLLTGLSPFLQYQGPAGEAFPIPVPVDGSLLGAAVTFQGVSADVTLQAIALTNALDTTVGSWTQGF